MDNIEQFSDTINRWISEIKYPAHPDGLFAPVRYTLDGGGKRLRPVLLTAVYQALGGNIEDVRNQALGIEMFHNFTLLHDDVMDNAEVRRGRPAVHCRWNTSTAILSGDAMLTMASMLMGDCAESHRSDVLRLFNDTAMEIYMGQQLDMDFENRDDVTVDEYMEMIRLKTSVLLGAACCTGAIMGGCDETACRHFYDYGIKLGLAFQLQDDCLDTYGDPVIFGKAIGGDILNDKKTWLRITAVNEDIDGAFDRIKKLNMQGHEKIETVKAIYDSMNLPGRCHELIERYINEAIESIKSTPIADGAKKFFIDLALKTSDRKQ